MVRLFSLLLAPTTTILGTSPGIIPRLAKLDTTMRLEAPPHLKGQVDSMKATPIHGVADLLFGVEVVLLDQLGREGNDGSNVGSSDGSDVGERPAESYPYCWLQ